MSPLVSGRKHRETLYLLQDRACSLPHFQTPRIAYLTLWSLMALRLHWVLQSRRCSPRPLGTRIQPRGSTRPPSRCGSSRRGFLGLKRGGARQRMARRRVNTADESIEQMRCVLGHHPGHRTLVPLTRGHSLPTHGKRRPSLNGKHLNGAVVVRAWPPA